MFFKQPRLIARRCGVHAHHTPHKTPQTPSNNNNNTIRRGSVSTGEEPPHHSGELSHAVAQPNPKYPALCRQDTTSPRSTDFGGNIIHLNSETDASNEKN